MNKWRVKTDWMGFEKGYEPIKLLERLLFYKDSIWVCEVSIRHARLFPDIFEVVRARWVPKKNEYYYYVCLNTASTDTYIAQSDCWHDWNGDNCRLQHNNVYKTEEQAKRAADFCRTSGKDLLTALREFTENEIENGNL